MSGHPNSQQRRILSYTVTSRWLRPQIEPPSQPSDNQPDGHELPPVGSPVQDRPHGNAHPVRKIRKGKKKKSLFSQRISQQADALAAGDAVAHESDPNEPRYCYCNNVSYGAVRVVHPSSVFLSLRTTRLRWFNAKIPQNVHAIG